LYDASLAMYIASEVDIASEVVSSPRRTASGCPKLAIATTNYNTPTDSKL
jgi:hypothetical protein